VLTSASSTHTTTGFAAPAAEHLVCCLPACMPVMPGTRAAGKVSKLSLRMMFEGYKRPKSKL
jgi:hypothetical protein